MSKDKAPKVKPPKPRAPEVGDPVAYFNRVGKLRLAVVLDVKSETRVNLVVRREDPQVIRDVEYGAPGEACCWCWGTDLR
jgi:hypothetical protein